LCGVFLEDPGTGPGDLSTMIPHSLSCPYAVWASLFF
jgi:hypothetical protein